MNLSTSTESAARFLQLNRAKTGRPAEFAARRVYVLRQIALNLGRYPRTAKAIIESIQDDYGTICERYVYRMLVRAASLGIARRTEDARWVRGDARAPTVEMLEAA